MRRKHFPNTICLISFGLFNASMGQVGIGNDGLLGFRICIYVISNVFYRILRTRPCSKQ